MLLVSVHEVNRDVQEASMYHLYWLYLNLFLAGLICTTTQIFILIDFSGKSKYTYLTTKWNKLFDSELIEMFSLM